MIVAALCLGTAAAILYGYPLSPWPLAVSLVVYAGALWRWPALWLAVIPVVLPALDLAPWTGWLFLAESDLFVLVTLGILLIRTPPSRADVTLGGFRGGVLALFIFVYLASTAIGLMSAFGPPGGSANPYLLPENALRIAKGFFSALALLPFIRERLRTHGDAVTWFGIGMAGGLVAVATATLVERAVFVGVLDFTSDYRVVSTFSSMHLGGGHIGAYVAMAFPFLLVGLRRRHPMRILLTAAIAAAAAYTLVVSFARTAYVAVIVAALFAGAAWVFAARRRYEGALSASILPILLVTAVAGIIGAAALDTDLMSSRLRTVAGDFAIREGNWTEGLELRTHTIVGTLFGTGIGTFPRAALLRRSEGTVPTNFVLRHEGSGNFLSMDTGSTLYLGQKVAIEPGQSYRLSLSLRTTHGQAQLEAVLCEKLLLYSMNCRGAHFQTMRAGAWQRVTAPLSSTGLAERSLWGMVRRPVELSLFDPVRGQTVQIADVRLDDGSGHDLLANGDFASAMDRWYFTDDDHLAWRIKNQYLMLFFEQGVLGLGAFVLLVGAALCGSVRAIGRGDLTGAAVAGSLVAFACSCIFDYLLEAPRIATIFYLVVLIGLTMPSSPPQKRNMDASA